MATPIRHIRSSVAGKIPATTDVDAGMLAINVRDGKLYTVQEDGAGGKAVVRLDSGTIRAWATGLSYKIGDVVLADYLDEWKLYRAATAFVSGGATFPGTQAIGTEWEQIAPPETTGGNIIAGLGLSLSGNTINVNTANSTRIAVNANDIDLATAGTAGTYRQVTTDAYGRVTAGENPTTLAGYGIVDAQPLDATLTALAGLATAADQLIYATGADAFAVTALSSFARTILDDLTAAAVRATLELGTIATQNASNVSITGGSISNATISGGTSTGVGISGGTITDSAISGGTASGVAISGGTASGVAISGGTVDNAAISRSSLAEWITATAYTIGDFVLAVYESELRAFKAITNHTSSGTVFPGNQVIAEPGNNFVGDWQEVSPLRGTFGAVSFGSDFSFSSSITPPTLSASVNDYNPTGLATCNFIRLSSTTNVNITGLVEPNPPRNQALFLCNVGTSNISIVNESNASIAGNRFLIGGSKTLQRDEGVLLIYDDVSERWRSQAIQI